jgi:hypothetical protein
VKIIFLDIDEVMTGVRAIIAYGRAGHMPDKDLRSKRRWREECCLDPLAVGILGRILKETGAKVVISSSWRLGVRWQLFNKMFAAYDLPEVVVGRTAHIGLMRGVDILHWLEGMSDIEQYIIIDDSSDMLPEQKSRLVHVKGDVGLGYKDYKKAVELLGKLEVSNESGNRSLF